MNHTYAHKFPGGLRCEFTLTFEGTEMNWSPGRPPQSWRYWRTYYRWRNRCCADYANKTGVAFVITLDIPWAGVRSYELIARDSAAAYACISARRDGMVRDERGGRVISEGPPGFRDAILCDLERRMLELAPRSAGGAA